MLTTALDSPSAALTDAGTNPQSATERRGHRGTISITRMYKVAMSEVAWLRLAGLAAEHRAGDTSYAVLQSGFDIRCSRHLGTGHVGSHPVLKHTHLDLRADDALRVPPHSIVERVTVAIYPVLIA